MIFLFGNSHTIFITTRNERDSGDDNKKGFNIHIIYLLGVCFRRMSCPEFYSPSVVLLAVGAGFEPAAQALTRAAV